tara:strand:- start:1344 stop:3359 length:2016 start_codon:yes stop_codon:yes gene_type:complete
MNEEELKRLFSEANFEQPDAEKKRAAIEAANLAYSQSRPAQSKKSSNATQGNDDPDRPMTNIIDLSRREKMSQMSQRWIYSGMASAAVIVLAVGILFSSLLVPNIVGRPDTARNIEATPAEPSVATLEEIIVTGSRIYANDERELEEVTVSTPQAAQIEYGIAASRMKAEAAKYASATSKMAEAKRLQSEGRMFIDPMSPPEVDANQDNFQTFETNPIKLVKDEPVSTFSIDVDTASYSYVRRQLNQGVLPAKSAVRLEEMLNYFSYDYPVPVSTEAPFLPTVSVLPSPWNAHNKLVHIGIKGYELPASEVVRSNLVFLLDVSGSMNQPDKLPLVKQSMSMLLGLLQPEDTVAIVVYAGAAGTILEPTPVSEKQKILSALNRLSAGGSTAGAEGIQLAYQLAESSFVRDGVNRVFLATDGDFNVGMTNRDDLQGFIERKRESGIYLSILGFGQGNYQDALMQQLAQNGNGIATYIDTLGEAQKVLVEEAQSQLFPIANDVKLQVEFNPATVSEYRLLGYETRGLKREDFNNDKVDAGEIGAGHSVTAIYEITPRGSDGLLDESRYESTAAKNQQGDEYGFLKIRYKKPGEKVSKLISQPINMDVAGGSEDARFAAAVAGFAQLLKDGRYTGQWSLDDALQMALENKGQDTYGYRAELTQLIRKAITADEMR